MWSRGTLVRTAPRLMPLTLGRAVEDGRLSRIFRCFRAVYAYRRTYFALVRDCAQGGGAVGQQFRGARGRGARRGVPRRVALPLSPQAVWLRMGVDGGC
jgi:hypothetical protein